MRPWRAWRSSSSPSRVVLFGGDGSHKYKLVFQNAAQLVPDNQVLIGGQAVGSVESIELTDDNLAEIEVSVEQELHEGSTAVIRATSLSGVANHYVSISPGPNSNPALDDGATLGLGSTTTEVDLDQFLNTFPQPGAPRPRPVHPRQRRTVLRPRQGGQRDLQVLRPGAQPGRRLRRRTERRPEPARTLRRQLRKLSTAVAQRGNELSSAISNASTAFGAIASQNEALDQTLRLLPPFMRQSNTTFVNLRAALDDLDPLVETAKPATKNLAPFLAELRPVLSKAVPVFRDLRLSVSRQGFANDTAEALGFLPAVQERAAKAFPQRRTGDRGLPADLHFARAYTPDIFNGFGKLGQITGYYDGNGHYARAQLVLNLFKRNAAAASWNRSRRANSTTPSAARPGRGGPAPAAPPSPPPDGSNPFTEPPFAGSGVSPSSDCDPADAPPGP